MNDKKLSEEYRKLHSWHPEFYGKLQRLESQVETLKADLKAEVKENEKYKRIIEHHKWVANQNELLPFLFKPMKQKPQ